MPSARRATIEDLPQLVSLWKEEHLPWEELERHLTEFQVVTGADEQIVAAIGVSVQGNQGRIYGEVIHDFDQADALRGVLWNRVRMVATNHGLVRVWTREGAPFWHTNGFAAPAAEIAAKLPPVWGPEDAHLLVLPLRAEPAARVLSADQEFALFTQASKAEAEEMQRKAKLMKTLALLIAIAVFGSVLAFAVYFFKNRDKLERARGSQRVGITSPASPLSSQS